MEEKRFSYLEDRVAKLELEIKSIKDSIKPSGLAAQKVMQSDVSINSYQASGLDSLKRAYPPSRSAVQLSAPDYRKKNSGRTKPLFNEAAIGKYLIGGLTSLLVFTAVIYLVTVFWNHMSNEIKFGLVMLGSLGVSAAGYLRLSKHRDVVTSLLLGIGAGASFIGLAAGHIALNVMSQMTTVVLISVWGAALFMSFKYTKMFFLTVIAYIGSLFAVVFMLVVLNSDPELLITVLFSITIISISVVSSKMYADGFLLRVTYILAFLMPMVITLFVQGSDYYEGAVSEAFANGVLFIQIGLMLCIAWFYYHSLKETAYGAKSVFLEIMISLTYATLSAVFELDRSGTVLGMGQLLRNIIVTIIWLPVFIAFIRHSLLSLLTFASTLLYLISTAGLGLQGLGFLAVALCFLNHIPLNKNKMISSAFVLLSGFILLSNDYSVINLSLGHVLFFIVESVAVISAALLLVCGDKEKSSIFTLRSLKKLSLGLTIIAVLTAVFASLVPLHYTFYELRMSVVFLVVSAGLAACIMSGIWSNYDRPDFKWFGRDCIGRLDLSGRLMSYALTLPYLFGTIFIAVIDTWYVHLILTLGLVILVCVQSAVFYLRHRNSWLLILCCVKFLILTWTVLWTVTGIDVMHIVASLIAISLAFAAVLIGSKFKLKSLRIFGLVLTPIMVAKMLLSDLRGGSSIAYVIALLVGAGLCFLIVLIYQRLSIDAKSFTGVEK